VILWCDGAHDPAENMRRDAALLAGAEQDAEPVLRLFRFAPVGITLGRNQDPARELDLERCAADGIPWARRPTGGRAIFHAEEWTYALAAPLDHPEWGGSQRTAFARVSAFLVASLARLGVPAAFTPRALGRAPGPTRPRQGPSDPCFASAARHEVVVGSRKLVGSAQRRTAHGLLQQGSLLLGEGHLRLADYLPLAEEQRARLRAALAASTTHAGDRLGSAAPLERWAAALLEVLPSGVRRLDGGAGAFLLTLSKTGSYTPAPLQTTC